jgi:hypothetical protein
MLWSPQMTIFCLFLPALSEVASREKVAKVLAASSGPWIAKMPNKRPVCLTPLSVF